MPAKKLRPLWRCPQCGAEFVTPHQWHSCGNFSLDALFAKARPEVRELFEGFAALVRRCGTVTLIPQKTRAVFMARVRFVAVYPRKEYLLGGIVLRRRIEHPRIVKVEPVGGAVVHYVRLRTPADLGAELLDWLRESYCSYGRPRPSA